MSVMTLLKNTHRDQSRVEGVDRFKSIDEVDFKNKYAVMSIPFIVEDYAKTSIGIIDSLIKIAGNEIISVRTGDYANPDNYVFKREVYKMKLANYINMAAGEERRNVDYAGNFRIPNMDILSMGIKYPIFYEAKQFESETFWIGPAGCVTPLHSDSADNFIYQLVGKKRWILYPIRDFDYLYMFAPFPQNDPDFFCSKIDLRYNDHQDFPKFAEAFCIDVILNEGEMLYLPAGWSHYVETLSFSVMVNSWLDNKLQKPASITKN